jgi:hypothetical protein
MAQFVNPNDAQTPFLPLEELLAKGISAVNTPSCAVFAQDSVRGCVHAKQCIFSQPEYGGYGPQSLAPGTGGHGPHNAAFYRRDAISRTERMDYMPCYAVMATLYDGMRQQHVTGDTIEILGGEGTEIVVQRLMPVDPNSNKSNNSQMQLVTETVVVPPFRGGSGDPSPMLEYAQEMAQLRKKLALERMQAEVQAARPVHPPDPAVGGGQSKRGPVAKAEPVAKAVVKAGEGDNGA